MNSYILKIRSINDPITEQIVEKRNDTIESCKRQVLNTIKLLSGLDNPYSEKAGELLNSSAKSNSDLWHNCISILFGSINTFSCLTSQQFIDAYCLSVILYIDSLLPNSQYIYCSTLIKIAKGYAVENASNSFNKYAHTLYLIILEEARSRASYCLDNQTIATNLLNDYYEAYRMLDNINTRLDNKYEDELNSLRLEVGLIETMFSSQKTDTTQQIIDLFT